MVALVVAYFLFKTINSRAKVKQAYGNFERVYLDSLSLGEDATLWSTIPLKAQDKDAAFHINAYQSFQNQHTGASKFSLVMVKDHLDAMAFGKIQEVNHRVYMTPQQWVREKTGDTTLRYTKLPVQTMAACIIDPNTLALHFFDYKSKSNKIATIDTLGNITALYEGVFGNIDDGGLSVFSTILADADYIYCVSAYTNKVFKINRNNKTVQALKSIEKIEALPPIVKYRNSYSFKRNPYNTHPLAKLVNDKIYILSPILDSKSASKFDKGTHVCFIDVYDTSLNYKYSYMLKDINSDDITDFFLFENELCMVKNGRYMFVSTFLKN